jgi:hypothetical protein
MFRNPEGRIPTAPVRAIAHLQLLVLKNDTQVYQWLEAWAILVISSFKKWKKRISVRSAGRVLNGFDKRTFSQYWTNLHI